MGQEDPSTNFPPAEPVEPQEPSLPLEEQLDGIIMPDEDYMDEQNLPSINQSLVRDLIIKNQELFTMVKGKDSSLLARIAKKFASILVLTKTPLKILSVQDLLNE